MEKEIVIYTDGACRYNPGPGGYAGIIMYMENGKKINDGVKGHDTITTNNIMELTAVVKSLKYVEKKLKNINSNFKEYIIKVHTDSAYIANAINLGWLDSWKKNGWKTSKGLVKNKEIWMELASSLDKMNIELIKVKGHSDNKLNNLCDKIATTEADIAKEELLKKAKEEGNETDEESLREYILVLSDESGLTDENTDEDKTNEPDISDMDTNTDIEIDVEKENEEKEERQASTIVDLVKKIDVLQKENRMLKEELAKYKKDKN